MPLLPRTLCALALVLAGCGGGGGSDRSSSPGVVAGVLPGAPAGAVVHLLAPEVTVADGGLLGHGAAIVATVDVAPDGAFSALLTPDLPAPSVALISAPGRALLRAPLADLAGEAPLALVEEAVIVVQAQGPAGPEVDAVALVLDAAGAPMPVPPDTLASGATGELRATRLPAGDYTLLVGSADGQRHASLRVQVAEGHTVSAEARLSVDPEAERAFYVAALGARRAAALLEGAPLPEGEEVIQ